MHYSQVAVYAMFSKYRITHEIIFLAGVFSINIFF